MGRRRTKMREQQRKSQQTPRNRQVIAEGKAKRLEEEVARYERRLRRLKDRLKRTKNITMTEGQIQVALALKRLGVTHLVEQDIEGRTVDFLIGKHIVEIEGRTHLTPERRREDADRRGGSVF